VVATYYFIIISLLLQQQQCASLLHHFRDIVTYLPKFKGHVTPNTSLLVVIYACTSTVLLCIDQHTQFEMLSFTNSKDMIGGII